MFSFSPFDFCIFSMYMNILPKFVHEERPANRDVSVLGPHDPVPTANDQPPRPRPPTSTLPTISRPWLAQNKCQPTLLSRHHRYTTRRTYQTTNWQSWLTLTSLAYAQIVDTIRIVHVAWLILPIDLIQWVNTAKSRQSSIKYFKKVLRAQNSECVNIEMRSAYVEMP